VEKTVELAKYPVEGVIATTFPPSWRGLRVDYTSKLPNNRFGDELLTAMARGGVAVVEVATDSPAQKAGLQKGQVINQVAGKRIRNPREFARAVAGLKGPVSILTDLGEIVIP
jgi:S1-C subfamily serine protease